MSSTRSTKVPSFGTIPSGVDPALKTYLRNMSEALDIRLGRRGDTLDRAITLRELVDSGLAEQLKTTKFNPNNPQVDFGPPDTVTYARPPAPTGVTADGAFSYVTVFWDPPAYFNHAYAEVWRYDFDTRGDAVMIGVSSGFSYVDPVGSDTGYYYWVRFVNTGGVIGNFNATAGAYAETAPDVDTILDLLNGAITQSQLTTSLSTRINLIDAADTVAGSVAKRIKDAQTALQGQIDDLLAISEYDGATAYAIDDLVTYSGNLYRATAATTGNLPTDTAYWDLLGEYSSLGDAVANNAAAITQINYVDAASGSAAAQAIAALESTVDDPSTGLTATRALLTTSYATTASMTSAISAATLNLVSESDLSTALGDYTNTASLEATYYTITDGDAAIASAINTFQSSVLEADYTSTVALQASYYTKASAAGLEGQYSLKIDVNGRVAGFGLSNTSATYNGGVHSEFTVLADRFQIVNTNDNGDVITPFVVTTATTTLNGVSVPAGVYINQAYIKNGAITSAKIGNAQVDTAQIANLAVSTAQIDDLAVSGAKIENAAVTRAKIATAAIGTAQIDDLSVDTIKITGNAVSQSAYSSAGSTNSDSVTFTARGGTVMIWASFYNSSLSPARYWYLKRNGTVIKSLTSSSLPYTLLMFVDTPGSGSVTYTAECSIWCNRVELQVLEVLK